MVDEALPPWGHDPLSTFLSNAQCNERALGVNVPDLYALLQRVHGVFERVAAITEKESNEHLLPTRFLMARAHAGWTPQTSAPCTRCTGARSPSAATRTSAAFSPATTRMETDETYTYAVAQLTDRPLLITAALKATIEAGPSVR